MKLKLDDELSLHLLCTVSARDLSTLGCVIRDNFALQTAGSSARSAHLDHSPRCCVIQPSGTLLESLSSPPWRSDQSMRAFCDIISLPDSETKNIIEVTQNKESEKSRFDVYLVYELN